MGKRRKKAVSDFETWLLGFERQVGKPCVVSLLISKGDIEFLSCWDRRKQLELDEEDDGLEGEPVIDFERLKKDVKMHSTSEYIG